MCHFLSTAHQLFINLFINFFINCSSTFNFFLSTLCQLFINFTNLLSTVYQLLNNCLSAVYHSHRMQPPRTMVASGRTNSAFVQIAGLMQRVVILLESGSWRDKCGEPNQGVPKRITCAGGIKHNIKHPSPPATGFWAPVAPWHQAYTEG